MLAVIGERRGGRGEGGKVRHPLLLLIVFRKPAGSSVGKNGFGTVIVSASIFIFFVIAAPRARNNTWGSSAADATAGNAFVFSDWWGEGSLAEWVLAYYRAFARGSRGWCAGGGGFGFLLGETLLVDWEGDAAFMGGVVVTGARRGEGRWRRHFGCLVRMWRA